MFSMSVTEHTLTMSMSLTRVKPEVSFSALTLLVGWQEGHAAHYNTCYLLLKVLFQKRWKNESWGWTVWPWFTWKMAVKMLVAVNRNQAFLTPTTPVSYRERDTMVSSGVNRSVTGPGSQYRVLYCLHGNFPRQSKSAELNISLDTVWQVMSETSLYRQSTV